MSVTGLFSTNLFEIKLLSNSRAKMPLRIRYLSLLMICVLFYVDQWRGATATEVNKTDITMALISIKPCMQAAINTWILPQNRPPRNVEQLNTMCKTNAEALKCIKERLVTRDTILKRMIKSFMQERQRFLKKVCTNTSSDYTKTFLQAVNCVLDNKRTAYYNNDLDFFRNIQAIEKKGNSIGDYKTQLKYLCCSVLSGIENYTGLLKPQCDQYKDKMSDLIHSIVPVYEVELMCPDKDKYLEEICPGIPPLDPTSKPDLSIPGMATTLIVALTLGD